ncbi:MAG: imidazolonepropionase [Flavobacteriales bacterium]
MPKLLVKNIKGLVGVYDEAPRLLRGEEMRNFPLLENAYLAVEDGLIVGFGSMSDWEGISDWRNLEVIDADGKFVLPTFCDSHTHLVFAAYREQEFKDRINGLTYEEIAAKGGGILNSAKRLADTSENELFKFALERLNQVIQMGTGAIEIKSGYGLSVDAELKMLRVIKRLKELNKIPIKATLLAAHAFPKEYKENQQGYIDLIVKEILPQVHSEGLADYFDVFCERNYFSPVQTDQLLEAAAQFGLVPKIHVNQFSISGGIEVALKHKALSVDHLEVLAEEEIERLKNSNTIPTVLPSCSFFLGIPYAPARQMIDAGLPLALASDYNPGSTPSGNMQLVVSLACINQKLLPQEALAAATLNGAYAMGLENELGSLSIGKKANFILTKPMSSLEYFPYSFGEDKVERVYLEGQISV